MDPDTPIPSIAVEVPKKPHGNKGKALTDKQKANLEKGRIAMLEVKKKREEEKARRKEKEKKKRAGEPVSESESEAEVPPPPKKKETPKEDAPKPIIQYIPVKPRKERKDIGMPKPPSKRYASREDFEEFKTSILDTIKTTPMIKEVEKQVDRIVDREVVKEVPVEKTKVLSGSALLNKVFFGIE